MFDVLFKSIAEKVAVTEQELEICKNYFTPKKLRRKQCLLQEGNVCNRLVFVEKGALLSYAINEKGTQQVMQFAFEVWWISDLYSFFTLEPSRLNIEAMEDCELLLLNREQHTLLLKDLPAYETYTQILYQNSYSRCSGV